MPSRKPGNTRRRKARSKRRFGSMNASVGLFLLATPKDFASVGHGTSLDGIWMMSLAVVMAAIIIVIMLVRTASGSTWNLGRGARRLSPKKIVEYEPDEEPPSPEKLSRQIVERTGQIHATLNEAPSEVEIEMCLMGYAACADDLIELARMIEEDRVKAGPLRRLRLRMAWRRANNSLSRARLALPPGALRTLHRKRSRGR